MLVLTRRCGESVVIGEEITVRILKVQRGLVRLGITAPRTVRVLRSELREATVEFDLPATDEDTISGAKTVPPEVNQAAGEV